MFLPPSQKLNKTTPNNNKKLKQLKLPLAVCLALASTFSFANNELPDHINPGNTVTGNGGFDGVSYGTYNFNDVQAIIGIALNIDVGTGKEALTGKTTTAFTITNATVNADGTIKIINNAKHENIGNNNALYAKGSSQVTLNAENVFIASLPSFNKYQFFYPKKRFRNHSKRQLHRIN